MLTNNDEFKRLICQKFDPSTDYSQCDRAEIDGVFEATVLELVSKKENPSFSIGDSVAWVGSDGWIFGEVLRSYPQTATLVRGDEVELCEGSDRNPALVLLSRDVKYLRLAGQVKKIDHLEYCETPSSAVKPQIDFSEFADIIKKTINEEIQSIDFRAIIHQVIRWNGLSIGLEYRPGDIRFKGTGYERKLKCGYGHIRNHVGNDGEALDCYLAPSFFDEAVMPSDRMFKVSQLSPEDGDFDEEKFMLGFESIEDAESAYLREMTPAHFGGIEEVTTTNSIKHQKPINYSELIEAAFAPFRQEIIELTEKVKVEGRVLSEEEYNAIASVTEDDISAAVEDWKEKTPDAYENVLEA